MPVAEEVTAAIECKNCATIFEGKFCPNCAQKANTHRFTVRHFLHEFFHAFTHTDKGIWFLIREMTIRPGTVALEYNSGKRKKYFNPFSFMLILMAINVFLTQKTDFYGSFLNASEEFLRRVEQLDGKTGPDKDQEETLAKARAKSPKMIENSKLLTSLVFLPVLSLLTWLFFKDSTFNFAENLVLNTLLQGQLSLLFIFFCLVPFMIYEPLVIVLPYLFAIVSWFYLLVAFRQFFRRSKWTIFWRGSILQIIYYVFAGQATDLLLDLL